MFLTRRYKNINIFILLEKFWYKKRRNFMQTISKNITLNFNQKDVELAKEVITFALKKFPEIENYFEIKTFPVAINIWDDFDKFAKKMCEGGAKIGEHSSVVANASKDEDVIDVLTFEIYKTRPKHEKSTFEDFKKTILHEYVHLCHQKILLDKTKMPAFMMEGIATYLSKQNLLAKGVAKIDCSGADLMQNFYNTPNAYGYSGLVAEYLDKTKTHKQMLEILKEPHKVDANVLVQETNLFLQKNRVKNLKICDKSV